MAQIVSSTTVTGSLSYLLNQKPRMWPSNLCFNKLNVVLLLQTKMTLWNDTYTILSCTVLCIYCTKFQTV